MPNAGVRRYDAEIEADFDVMAVEIEIDKMIQKAIDDEVPDMDRRRRLKEALK